VSIESRRVRAALTLLLSLSAAAAAQGQVKIELHSDGQWIPLHYVCELEDIGTHQRVARADIGTDNTFTLRNVPAGEYRMTIVDGSGQVVHVDLIGVNEHVPPIQVQLPNREGQRPPSGPVSFQHLLHPPAHKALAAFTYAQRLSESGDYAHAAAELEKAIRISPDYAEAYNNLAVQYIRLGEFQRAVAEMQHAARIAKPGPVLLCNLAFAQAQLKDYVAAADSARAAIRLDANYDRAHYLLGVLLAGNAQNLAEAKAHLEKAAQTLPSAKRFLDQLRP
jgi:hypothetical protein